VSHNLGTSVEVHWFALACRRVKIHDSSCS